MNRIGNSDGAFVYRLFDWINLVLFDGFVIYSKAYVYINLCFTSEV